MVSALLHLSLAPTGRLVVAFLFAHRRRRLRCLGFVCLCYARCWCLFYNSDISYLCEKGINDD